MKELKQDIKGKLATASVAFLMTVALAYSPNSDHIGEQSSQEKLMEIAEEQANKEVQDLEAIYQRMSPEEIMRGVVLEN